MQCYITFMCNVVFPTLSKIYLDYALSYIRLNDGKSTVRYAKQLAHLPSTMQQYYEASNRDDRAIRVFRLMSKNLSKSASMRIWNPQYIWHQCMENVLKYVPFRVMPLSKCITVYFLLFHSCTVTSLPRVSCPEREPASSLQADLTGGRRRVFRLVHKTQLNLVNMVVVVSV